MEEERCNELAENLDELSEQERVFCFWYLIDTVKELCENEAKDLLDNANDHNGHDCSYCSYLASIKANEHARMLGEVKDVLAYKLF